jgi:hypothetical protein
VLSILGVAGRRDVNDSLLESRGIALLESDLELEAVSVRGWALELPSCRMLALSRSEKMYEDVP